MNLYSVISNEYHLYVNPLLSFRVSVKYSRESSGCFLRHNVGLFVDVNMDDAYSLLLFMLSLDT